MGAAPQGRRWGTIDSSFQQGEVFGLRRLHRKQEGAVGRGERAGPALEHDAALAPDVVGRHLVRLGTRDELVVQWRRDTGEPGTTQRNPGDSA